jgi:MoxR-like ATPase
MINAIKKEMKKVIVGQDKMIDALLIGLLTNGHILLEGVPGLAKTLTINTLSKVLNLNFKRIQFTPDLLPTDIIGTEIYDIKSGEFRVKKGPIFANLILADEINRAPAKVQSALLEAMAEKQITIADENYKLDMPFLVMATQNPVEQEGTYNLPEAQLDRFMLKVIIGYNTPEEEFEIIKRSADEKFEKVNAVCNKDDIFKMQEEVKNIHIDDELTKYIVDLVNATRVKHKYIDFGASPRSGISLYKASKAVAYMSGRDYVIPVDIVSVVKDVFRHRIVLSYEAEADEVTPDKIIEEIIQTIPML